VSGALFSLTATAGLVSPTPLTWPTGPRHEKQKPNSIKRNGIWRNPEEVPQADLDHWRRAGRAASFNSTRRLTMSLKDVQAHIEEGGEHLKSAATELNAIVGSGGATAVSTSSSSELPIHQHYKIFRDYVEHEDFLVNNRLLWNINIQGLLFAAYAIALQRILGGQGTDIAEKLVKWLMGILPIFGIAISWLS
jgi:hypothetical protein